MNENQQFWYFLVEGTLDEKTGVFGNFYTYGTRCGNSLSKSFKIAKQEGILKPKLIETCRLDDIEDFEIPEECVEMNSDVFMLSTLNTFELKIEETEFTPPVGIAFGTDEGEFETDLIKECFVAYTKNENGIFELELVVDNYRLIETFLTAIDFLPSVDKLLINVLEHWNNQETELWECKNLIDRKLIKEFLTNNTEETLKNGFVDIVVHTKKGKTKLILNEHKKIQLHTKEQSVFDDFIEQMENLGFKQTKDYYNIEFGYYHWHYRTEKSVDREEFEELLTKNKFKIIK
jgi:hypothetical protein